MVFWLGAGVVEPILTEAGNLEGDLSHARSFEIFKAFQGVEQMPHGGRVFFLEEFGISGSQRSKIYGQIINGYFTVNRSRLVCLAGMRVDFSNPSKTCADSKRRPCFWRTNAIA